MLLELLHREEEKYEKRVRINGFQVEDCRTDDVMPEFSSRRSAAEQSTKNFTLALADHSTHVLSITGIHGNPFQKHIFY